MSPIEGEPQLNVAGVDPRRAVDGVPVAVAAAALGPA
jgi:hypothetical protein